MRVNSPGSIDSEDVHPLAPRPRTLAPKTHPSKPPHLHPCRGRRTLAPGPRTLAPDSRPMNLCNIPLARLKQQIGIRTPGPFVEIHAFGQNDKLQSFVFALAQDLRAFFRRKVPKTVVAP